MLDDGNPIGYALCVEAHDQGTMPSNALLRETDAALGQLADEASQLSSFSAVSLADTPDSPSSTYSTASHLRLPASSIPHLEILSSASHLAPSHSAPYITALLAFAAFLHAQSTASPARRVLLHCADGYTETSIPALAYVMLARRLSLPAAYVFLQEECGRSFFVYPHDVQLLLKVERRIRESEAREKGGEGMERSDSGFDEGELGRRAAPRRQAKASEPADAPWFFAESFDGHFPSRILSFLVSRRPQGLDARTLIPARSTSGT